MEALPSSIASPEDLKALIAEVQEYARWFRSTGIKRQVVGPAASAQAPQLSSSAITLLEQLVTAKQLTQASLDTLIANLKQASDAAPVCTITLAGPAPSKLKRDLVTWCRKNIAPTVMVSLKFDATLLGGMVVQYGSHIFDWSFRRQILANRGHFPEVLRRV